MREVLLVLKVGDAHTGTEKTCTVFNRCRAWMMSTIDRAIEIAVKAHAGQIRRNGTSYVLHPIRVMLRQSDPVAMIVAVLHDVVEDTDMTFADLEREGFSDVVLGALRLLTRTHDVAYEDYVRAIAANPLARAVKLADLEDNMNVRELPSMTRSDLTRVAKYHNAWQILVRSEHSGVDDA